MPVATQSNSSAVVDPALVVAAPCCKACGEAFDPSVEAFCHKCGQDTSTDRFTVRSFVQKAFLDAFDIHHGLLHTAVELTRRPGPTIREYILGNRVHHYNPVKYFLLFFTLSVLVDEWTGTEGSIVHSGLTTLLAQLGGQRLTVAEVPLMLAGLVVYCVLFVVSIRLVRAKTYNVPETLTFLLFSLGHYLLLSTILLLPVSLLWPVAMRYSALVTFPGFLVFLCWNAKGFYSNHWEHAIGTILGGHLRMLPLALLLGLLPYAVMFLLPLYLLFLTYFLLFDLLVWLRHRLYGEAAFQQFLVRQMGRKKAAQFRHWSLTREGLSYLRTIGSRTSWRGI